MSCSLGRPRAASEPPASRQACWGPAQRCASPQARVLSAGSPQGEGSCPPPYYVTAIQLGSIFISMLECACRLEGKGDLLFKGDGLTDRCTYVCYYSSLQSISIVSEYLRGEGRLALQREAEKHLPWRFVQPCTGRWNFFPDAVGICLTPCSMCSGCFGSGLAQC